MRDVIAHERSRGARKRAPSAHATTTKAATDLVCELEEAVRTFPSQRGLEEAAAALAAVIRKGLPHGACAEPRRAGVSDAEWRAYEEAVRRREADLAHSRFTVLYAVAHIWDRAGARLLLARDAQDAFPGERNHWWLLEPLLDDTNAAVDVNPRAAGFPLYHKATPTVLCQFAEEARDLIAEFARELQWEVSDLTEKVQQLEQLVAAAPSAASS